MINRQDFDNNDIIHIGIKGMKWGKKKVTSKTTIKTASQKIAEAEARAQTKPWTDKINDKNFLGIGDKKTVQDSLNLDTNSGTRTTVTKTKHVTITEIEKFNADTEKGRKYIKEIFKHL